MGHRLTPTSTFAAIYTHHPHPYNRGWWWGLLELHHPHLAPTHSRPVGKRWPDLGVGLDWRAWFEGLLGPLAGFKVA